MTASATVMAEGAVVYSSITTATIENDVRNGPCRVYELRVANAGTAAYVKLWDSLAPVAGTTGPDYVFLVPASSTIALVLGVAGEGVAFSVGLSVGASADAGTTHSASPNGAMTVSLFTS